MNAVMNLRVHKWQFLDQLFMFVRLYHVWGSRNYNLTIFNSNFRIINLHLHVQDMLIAFIIRTIALLIEGVSTSETSVSFIETTRCNIPADGHLRNLFCFFYMKCSHVLTQTWLRAGRPGDRGSIPGGGQRIFPLTSVFMPALGPTQPPVQWVPGVLSPGVKARPGRDADHSPPSSAEVENE
jgi:hypothetical protein